MRVINFYIPGIYPIEFVIQEQSDLYECKNWYLANIVSAAFMVEEFMTTHKIVETFTFNKGNILDRLEGLKAP